MRQPNLRKWLHCTLVGLKGQALRRYCERFGREDRDGILPSTIDQLLGAPIGGMIIPDVLSVPAARYSYAISRVAAR